MDFKSIKARDKEYIANSYNRQDVWFKKGRGARLYDDQNREYIDFASGIGVSSLGYGDKQYLKAVLKQLGKLCHSSNLFYTAPDGRLAAQLCQLSGMKKVFFSNSGAEANECAIKAARKYSFDKYGEGRSTVLTLRNSFHGRTVTTLAATGQDKFHNYFFPFTEGFRYVDANDVGGTVAAMDDTVCAVMLEPVQGEGGVLPLSGDYVRAVAKEAAKRDILLIMDEVQTGIGLTEKFFGFEHFEVKPDIVSLAKGLGGGLPIGATLLGEKVERVFGYGDQGSTFGGNPVVCAGACEVVRRVSQPAFLDEVAKKGALIRSFVAEIHSPYVKEVRGRGLMLGLALEGIEAAELSKKLLAAGLVTLTAGGNTLRLLPPLIISESEIERGVKILGKTLKGMEK